MKVSVLLLTYNHEKFIAKAIESVLGQKTNFEFEILIGEDDSSDDTRRIVLKYKESNPDKIKLLLNDRKNVIFVNGHPTGRRNLINCIENARGDYIALLDGDDYWTDPLKLQKQADVLDNEKDVVLTFLNTIIKYQNGDKKSRLAINKQKKILKLKDLIQCAHFDDTNPLVGPAHSSTAFFRNGLLKSFPKWFYKSASGDLPLYMLLGKYGNAKFINEIASVYRKNDGGVTVKKGHMFVPIWLNRIEMYKAINVEFNSKYKKTIKPIISRFYMKIAWFYRDRNKPLFLKAITKAILNDPSILQEALNLIFRYKYRIRVGIDRFFFHFENFIIFCQSKK